MTTPIDVTIAWYEQAKATAASLRTDDPAYAAAVSAFDAAHAGLARILNARRAAYRSPSGSIYGYSAHEDSVVVVPQAKGRKGQPTRCPVFPTPDPQEEARQAYVRQAHEDRAVVLKERFANQEG